MKQEHGWKVPHKNVTLRFSIGSDDDAAASPAGHAAPPHAAPAAQPYAAAPAAPVYAPPANAYAAPSHSAPVMQTPHQHHAPHQPHQHHAPREHKEEDIRVKLLGTIWGCAMGMLGICIPLMAVAGRSMGDFAAVLPLGVVAGAASASIAVLSHFKGSASSAAATHDARQMTQQATRLHELEERLANLETINSFERRLAEDALARDRAGAATAPISVPTAPIARDVVAPAETTYHFVEPEATQTVR